MLKSLAIENYALIDSLRVEWDEHLNIITGETGAGKSILLGALGLLLGAKTRDRHSRMARVTAWWRHCSTSKGWA